MPLDRAKLLAELNRRRAAEARARRELAECLIAEAAAERLVRRREEAIARETEAATSPGAGDTAVEAFGTWLRQARRNVTLAHNAWDRACVETTRARATLAAARAAVAAADIMLAGATDQSPGITG
jgi:hypothetical protein